VRINNPSALQRDTLIKYLIEGICQSSFIKVKDGTNRVMYCTLNTSLIPSKFTKSLEKVFKEAPRDDDVVPVWDIAEGKWKSFRISKMVFFLTADELQEENKKGTNVSPSSSEIVKQRNAESIERFEKRKQELKEKSKSAANKINGEQNESEA